MSVVYEAQVKTSIKDKESLLFDFLNKAINSKAEPDAAYFQQFKKSEWASSAFEFVRYSNAPENVWSAPYSDLEVDDIARTWRENAKYNSSDAEALKKIGLEAVINRFSLLDKIFKPDLTALYFHIRTYRETSFSEGEFFFANEYSSNDLFSAEKLIEFLNANRDCSESLYAVFSCDDQVMPTVTLYLDGAEIELFSGAYNFGFRNLAIQYDRNGFFCGEYNSRPENHLASGDYQFLPPADMKYKIDWFNEDDIKSVRSAYERYVKT